MGFICSYFYLWLLLLVNLTISSGQSDETCTEPDPADLSGNKDVGVSYTVWDGTEVLHHSLIRVLAKEDSSLYSVMKIAANHDPQHYEFTAECTQWGHYITSIGGFKENAEKREYWLIYKLPGLPDINNPPDKEQLTPKGVDKTFIKDGDNYLFWLRNTE